jgi:hypothetical protein
MTVVTKTGEKHLCLQKIAIMSLGIKWVNITLLLHHITSSSLILLQQRQQQQHHNMH